MLSPRHLTGVSSLAPKRNIHKEFYLYIYYNVYRVKTECCINNKKAYVQQDAL